MVIMKKKLVQLPMTTPVRHHNIANNNPEELLKTIRKVSETLSARKPRHLDKNQGKFSKCNTLILFTVALFTTAWGLASFIFSPLQMLLNIRLEMRPGFPQYDWWAYPPDEVLLKIYLFNITNSDRFLNGIDSRLHVEEVGPIIYREKILHKNPRRNPNSTLTYVANRTVVFLPEMNTINLNDPIIVPNLGALLIPAYFQDSSFLMKMSINVFLKSHGFKILRKMSIQDYLWNSTDTLLDTAEKLMPSLVPTKNIGILNMIYRDFENTVTVYIGVKHGNSKFLTINKYDGSEYLPHFTEKDSCQLKFRNSSEGIGYPQMITKGTNLTYWRRTVCNQVDVRYSRDDKKYGINAYRFDMVPWEYSRVEWEGKKDCYASHPTLPNGLSDVSTCYYGFPIAASFPHYLYADKDFRLKVDGMSPKREKHDSYVLIEPITGVPLEGKARSQINIFMKDLSGFPKEVQRFSHTIVPLAWLEYHQEGIPSYIEKLVYFIAVILPAIQVPQSLFSLAIGSISVFFLVKKRLVNNKNYKLITESTKRDSQSLTDDNMNKC
ncbi:hypothetical protein ABEB36_014361 [Hypothenemus hampei]|uniref:Scavenger receptor class B member 1 n=1 Tax=Hypothenemus hampei TaxID=57062 RepID=A0ABD1E457_HYPHA